MIGLEKNYLQICAKYFLFRDDVILKLNDLKNTVIYSYVIWVYNSCTYMFVFSWTTFFQNTLDQRFNQKLSKK